MNEKVSIIIPVYNTEKYIDCCIKSVLGQTYKNIEIILVEDGSTDNSLQKCKAIISEYKEIKLIIHELNMGQEATRNDGILAATGKWIYFLDSDDIIENDAIEKFISVGEITNAELVLCNFLYIDDGLRKVCKANITEGLYDHNDIISKLLVDIPWAVISCVGSKFYRSDMIKTQGLKFDIAYKYNEDGAFALNAINKSMRVYYLDYAPYNYILRHQGSVQSSYRANIYQTVKNIHILLNEIFTGIGCPSRNLAALCYQQVQFIYTCLKNEVDFKSYKEYRKTFDIIFTDVNYMNACEFVTRNSALPKRIFSKLFILKQYKIIYYIIKMRK